ncbi:MAG: nucleoside hydrolase [Bacillota bacterium]
MKKRNILIDCDPGVDDVMALLLALANQDKLNIIGVTTVSGNQTLAKVTKNLRKLWTFLHVDIPAACGASTPIIKEPLHGGEIHGESGMDGWDFPEPVFQLESDNAILFLREKIMASEGKVTIVPTGPLTNIGLLFSVFPETKKRVEMISLMGGSIYSGNRTPFAEFNIYADPEAAKIVFDSGIPIVMSGLEVTNKAAINDREIKDLMESEGMVSRMSGHLLDSYTDFHRKKGQNTYPLHDVVSVMYLIKPEIFEGKDHHVAIDTSIGVYRGRTAADTGELMRHDKPNAYVLLNVDREEFMKTFFNALKELDKLV